MQYLKILNSECFVLFIGLTKWTTRIETKDYCTGTFHGFSVHNKSTYFYHSTVLPAAKLGHFIDFIHVIGIILLNDFLLLLFVEILMPVFHCVGISLDSIRDIRFGLQWTRLFPNETNLGFFKISFQYILAHRAKMYWKMILKSLRCILFGANLAHFEAESNTLLGTEVRRKFAPGVWQDSVSDVISGVLRW